MIIFGGNVGKPQKLENIVTLAQNCKEYRDIIFLIIDSDTEFNKISNILYSLNLVNIKIIQAIPRLEYNKLLRVAEVGLISLNEQLTIPNFPSKVLSYFGAKSQC